MCRSCHIHRVCRSCYIQQVCSSCPSHPAGVPVLSYSAACRSCYIQQVCRFCHIQQCAGPVTSSRGAGPIISSRCDGPVTSSRCAGSVISSSVAVRSYPASGAGPVTSSKWCRSCHIQQMVPVLSHAISHSIEYTYRCVTQTVELNGALSSANLKHHPCSKWALVQIM